MNTLPISEILHHVVAHNIEILPKGELRVNERPKQILIEQARLCCHVEIPKSLIELDRILWKAFDLGKQYRDSGGKE